LSTHLRPDVAKVVAACADAMIAADNDEALAERIFANNRTKKQREALQKAVELLSTLTSLDEDRHGLRSIVSVLSTPPAKPARPAPQLASNAAKIHVATELVERFAAELDEARLDRDRFVALHRQLNDAKRVNTPTLQRIAQVFLQHDTKYSGRKKALDDILRRHHDLLRIAAQDQMLDRLR
jgi:vacuolar-type H+-ATPase subunit I/STV1